MRKIYCKCNKSFENWKLLIEKLLLGLNIIEGECRSMQIGKGKENLPRGMTTREVGL